MTNNQSYQFLFALAQIQDIEKINYSTRCKIKRGIKSLMPIEEERQTISGGDATDEEKSAAWNEFAARVCNIDVERFTEEEFANTTTHHQYIDVILAEYE